MKPGHLKGDSYRLNDRTLRRCLLTTTEPDDGPGQGLILRSGVKIRLRLTYSSCASRYPGADASR